MSNHYPRSEEKGRNCGASPKARPIGQIQGYKCLLVASARRLKPWETDRTPIVHGSEVRFFPENIVAEPADLGKWAILELGMSPAKAAKFVMGLREREFARIRAIAKGL